MKSRYFPESAFGGFTDIDGTLIFYSRINALLRDGFVLLDVGCGRGVSEENEADYKRKLTNLRTKVKKVIGIDVDVAGQINPKLDEFRLIQGDTWPVDAGEVDIIIGDWVLEHVSDPQQFFKEARRVLKPGGYICLRTSNRWSYLGIASALIPNKLHSRVLSKVQDSRKVADVFPTVYRANTVPKLRRLMKNAGFDSVVYGYEAEPGYFSFSSFAYWLATLHQRYAPKLIRPTIFAFGQKPLV